MATLDHLLPRPAAKASPRPLGLRPILATAAAALIIIGLLQVIQTSDATTTGFAIQRLQQDELDWQARVHHLEAEVAALASLERVQQEAQGRLGMVPAEERLYLEVNAPLPEAPLIPTRFLPDAESGVAAQGAPWWQDLLKLLPFY